MTAPLGLLQYAIFEVVEVLAQKTHLAVARRRSDNRTIVLAVGAIATIFPDLAMMVRLQSTTNTTG